MAPRRETSHWLDLTYAGLAVVVYVLMIGFATMDSWTLAGSDVYSYPASVVGHNISRSVRHDRHVKLALALLTKERPVGAVGSGDIK
jgi:hypothetical protein